MSKKTRVKPSLDALAMFLFGVFHVCIVIAVGYLASPPLVAIPIILLLPTFLYLEDQLGKSIPARVACFKCNIFATIFLILKVQVAKIRKETR